MKRLAGILAVILVFGGVIYRLFFWGMDVAEYVETEQRNETISFSNQVIDDLNHATDGVTTMHDVLRRASDPTSENHRGTVLLLELSDDLLTERLNTVRNSIDEIDASEQDNAQDFINAANILLNTYESFVPVHEDLTAKILASEDYPIALTQEVDATLGGLEGSMNNAIDAFTVAQTLFLE